MIDPLKKLTPAVGDEVYFYRRGCFRASRRVIDRVDDGSVHIVCTGKKPRGVTVSQEMVRRRCGEGGVLWEYHSFNS